LVRAPLIGSARAASVMVRPSKKQGLTFATGRMSRFIRGVSPAGLAVDPQ